MCAFNFELIFLLGGGMADRDQYLLEGLFWLRCCFRQRLGRSWGSSGRSKLSRNFELRVKLWLRRIYWTDKVSRDWKSSGMEMVDDGHSCCASFRTVGVGATGSLEVPEELT